MNLVKQQMPTGELTLKVDEARLPLDWLIGFAARANAKRGFLFLSKVLGKHWPVTPRAMQAIHDDLAAQIPPSLPGPVVFIAMAETAVGLGQGVFEAWLRANPNGKALFLHSSRYRVGTVPFFEFEESHSHAPRQFLHAELSALASAIKSAAAQRGARTITGTAGAMGPGFQPESGPAEAAAPGIPVRRETAKVGRNDACPCGSGRKYKKCCGA